MVGRRSSVRRMLGRINVAARNTYVRVDVMYVCMYTCICKCLAGTMVLGVLVVGEGVACVSGE